MSGLVRHDEAAGWVVEVLLLCPITIHPDDAREPNSAGFSVEIFRASGPWESEAAAEEANANLPPEVFDRGISGAWDFPVTIGEWAGLMLLPRFREEVRFGGADERGERLGWIIAGSGKGRGILILREVEDAAVDPDHARIMDGLRRQFGAEAA